MTNAHSNGTEKHAAIARDSVRDESGFQSALQRRLMELTNLDAAALRQEWRRLLRSDPPQLSRDLVLRALAYRLQEREQGGLSKSTLRLIAVQAREFGSNEADRSAPRTRLRPGARLVREWRGRTHAVTVVDDGFEYEGKTYGSLTHIARVITGAHWSGPRFFGLGRQPTKAGPPNSIPPAATWSQKEVAHG